MPACGTFADCFSTLMPRVLDAAFTIVAVASALAAVTPTPSDDGLAGRVYRILDILALNVGYAKDKPKRQGGRFVAD